MRLIECRLWLQTRENLLTSCFLLVGSVSQAVIPLCRTLPLMSTAFLFNGMTMGAIGTGALTS